MNMTFLKLKWLAISMLLVSGSVWAQDFAAVSFGSTDDYISTSWNPTFGTDQDFSVEFSVRSDGWSSDPAILSDKDWDSGSNPGFNIALAGNGSGIDVNIGDGTNRADLETGMVNDGEWHHVLVAFDRDGELAIWIDGILSQSTDLSGVGNIDSPYNFNIGQDGTGTYGQATTCAITNLRVWNLALSFDDVATIACNEITPGHPLFFNLLHYWPMQEGTGTTVADFIGGLDGNFNGNPAWLEGFFPNLDASFDYTVDLSTVEFMNTSVDATAFNWAFGDGGMSTLENPTYTYLATGAFDVTFTASNACESQEVIQTVQIDELNSNLKLSIDLDGNDDLVQLTNDLDFGADQDFTIQLLVRSEGWNSDPSIIANKDWNSGANPGFVIAGKSDGTTWKFNIGDGAERIDLDGGVINDGLWHHIAITYDQDGAKKLYHDGEVLEESMDILGNVSSPLDLAIGQDGTFTYGAFFAGQVAEVRIWNVALDSATIVDYSCEADADHPNYDDLLHYWKLDEGMGTLIADSKGSNNGVYNGEWTTTLFTLNCGEETTEFNAAQLASTSREDYLTTDWNPTFGTDQDFSVDFRIRSFGWDGDPAIVADKDWNSGNNPGFVIAFNGNSIKVNAGSGSNRADVNGTTPMNDGQWHHVLATFDRDGNLELFLDGVSQGTDLLGGDVLDMNSPHTFKIGQDGTGNYPIGFSTSGPTSEIAFVRVWDRVVELSEASACEEIDETNPLWEDLLHLWKMDEGAGILAADSKGGQDATWVNNEAWTFFNDYQTADAQFDASIQLSTVSFINNSSVGTYFWDFGDGETTTNSDPTHTYLQTGDFEVQLIVTGNCSADTLTQTITISALDANLLTSLDFDGTDDLVVLQNDLAFGADQDFTIELYVRSEGWGSDPSIISDKDWDSGSNPGFIIAGKGDGTTWKFNIGDGTERIDLDGGVINDGQWHHLAVSYDQDGAKKLYHDGELLAESMDILGDVSTALDLAIGQDGTLNYGAYFSGQVAEVRIWNTVLDETTLNEYVCGVEMDHPNFADLLHYWKGDEGTGTEVNDAFAANTGTYNGSWAVTANTIDACLEFAPVNDIGSGNAVRFDAINDWIDCSGNDGNKIAAESLNLPTDVITLECWVKPHTYSIWHSMVAFMQDNGSFEKGWDLETRDDKKFAFALNTTGNSSLTYLETTNTFEEETWYHVAGVYDGTEQRIYVNGVLEATATAQSGPIDYADSWLALGMYKDDNEAFSLDGTLDEVRIWNVARTQEELQADMCRKLTGDEAGLVAYFRLDNLAGEEVRDYGPNQLNGLMQNMNPATARVVSGAALGDESLYLYTDAWTGEALAFTTDDLGTITAQNIEGDFLRGVHLYRVNELPNTTNGIFDIGDNSIYYGTYLVDRTNTAKHDLTYDYSNYPNAMANEATLSLYNRADNAIDTWFSGGATVDTDGDVVTLSNIGSRRELILGDFSMVPCPAPANISIDEAGFEEVTLSWVGTGTDYNLEYGPIGFVFGTGTLLEDQVGETLVLDGLEAATSYDLYLQADCGGGLFSSWTGPVTFTTADPCQVPFDVQTVVDAASATITFSAAPTVGAFDLQWGTPGFILGQGITVSSDDPMIFLDFLPANTLLEFYLRSNCTDEYGVVSEWIGPFSFMTDMIDGLTETTQATYFGLFPNPASEVVNVQILAQKPLEMAQLQVINTLGQVVYQQELNGGNAIQVQLDLNQLASGNYYVQLRTEQELLVQPLVID